MGKLLLICCWMLISALPVFAQKLVKLGQFTAFQETYDDTVQFLPGAVVVVHHDIQDGKNNIYKYRSGKFVRAKAGLPFDMRGWMSFNWESVDYRDQIDRSDFEERRMASFVPVGAKTKAFAVLPGKEKSIVFLCYSMVPGHEWDSGNERDLYLLMLIRGPFTRETSYKKLADLRITEASYFGGLFVQKQREGTFVLLYSTSGGNHMANSVTVLMVQ